MRIWHPWRSDVWRPLILVITLVLAVFLLPWPVAGWLSGHTYADVSALQTSVWQGLVAYWQGSTDQLSSQLQAAADFWRWFHVVKAALAGALLAVLVVLARRLPTWGVLVDAAAAFVALLVVVANVQGAVAPLTSALTLLAPGEVDSATGGQLAAALAAGTSTPSVDLLVGAFAGYHAVLSWVGGVVVVLSVGAAFLLWRSRMPRARRVVAAVAVVGTAAFFGVVAAANVSTMLDPGPAFAASL